MLLRLLKDSFHLIASYDLSLVDDNQNVLWRQESVVFHGNVGVVGTENARRSCCLFVLAGFHVDDVVTDALDALEHEHVEHDVATMMTTMRRWMWNGVVTVQFEVTVTFDGDSRQQLEHADRVLDKIIEKMNILLLLLPLDCSTCFCLFRNSGHAIVAH